MANPFWAYEDCDHNKKDLQLYQCYFWFYQNIVLTYYTLFFKKKEISLPLKVMERDKDQNHPMAFHKN